MSEPSEYAQNRSRVDDAMEAATSRVPSAEAKEADGLRLKYQSALDLLTAERAIADASDLERGALINRVEKLEAALREIEWIWDGDYHICPRCGGQEPAGRCGKKYGHASDCTLAAAIGGTP